MQARARMRRADALATQSCRAQTPAVAVGSDHGSGSDRKAQGNDGGSVWETRAALTAEAGRGNEMCES